MSTELQPTGVHGEDWCMDTGDITEWIALIPEPSTNTGTRNPLTTTMVNQQYSESLQKLFALHKMALESPMTYTTALGCIKEINKILQLYKIPVDDEGMAPVHYVKEQWGLFVDHLRCGVLESVPEDQRETIDELFYQAVTNFFNQLGE